MFACDKNVMMKNLRKGRVCLKVLDDNTQLGEQVKQ